MQFSLLYFHCIDFSLFINTGIICVKRMRGATLSLSNNNNKLRVSNIRVSNRTLIYNVYPKSALT